MKLSVISSDQFSHLILNKIPVLDVRAPVEFQAGAIPGSINLPILNDQERHEIGTIYKKQGQDAALAKGYKLVSGEVKEARVRAWKQAIQAHPETILTCFRGGKRSQITQSWLKEVGVDRPRIDGGYKAFRIYLIEELERLSKQKMCVISGATGSGKTLIVRQAQFFRPTVDLEGYANHRGSAFGGFPGGQPSQVDFENTLAAELLRLENQKDPRPLVVEDESRLIGRCAQPENFFHSLRSSGIVFVDESLGSRVQVTFDDYILNSPIGKGLSEAGFETFALFQKSLLAISKKLGGLRYSEVQKNILEAREAYKAGDLEPNRIWIRKLLEYYYDPLYFGSLGRRNPQILFRGSRDEVLEWLQNSK